MHDIYSFTLAAYLCPCSACDAIRAERRQQDLEREYGPTFNVPVMPTPEHKHVYRSLFGKQEEHFGTLECWCGKPMIYQVPEVSNASV